MNKESSRANPFVAKVQVAAWPHPTVLQCHFTRSTPRKVKKWETIPNSLSVEKNLGLLECERLSHKFIKEKPSNYQFQRLARVNNVLAVWRKRTLQKARFRATTTIQMWYWDIGDTQQETKVGNRVQFVAMPTLLEALEEKYGFAQISDIEAEPELLMLRLPKRTPRQRWLWVVINVSVFSPRGDHLSNRQTALNNDRQFKIQ